MNWIVITGICVIAVGTLIMSYGTFVSGRKDSERSDAKLSEITRQFETLRNEAGLPPESLDQVENDIAKWAKEFASDKEQRKLVAAQKRLDHETAERHKELLYRSHMEPFLSYFREAATNYSKTGYSIEAKVPSLPDKAFVQGVPEDYEGKVIWSAKEHWRIVFNGSITRTLMLQAIEDREGSLPLRKGIFFLSVSDDAKTFTISANGCFSQAGGLPIGTYQFSDFTRITKSAIKELFEFQLSQE